MTGAASLADTGVDAYLGRGVYDVVEVARLIRCTRRRVEGWTLTVPGSSPLLTGELGDLFSFRDLLSLRVIAELTKRGVPRDQIFEGARYLAKELDTDRPFAHRGLATVGKSFFADIDSWIDVGLGGQQAFQVVVEPLLKQITFDDSGMATIWYPHTSVWINPKVQAGAPCVDGTRTPTRTLADLHSTGIAAGDLADDYQLPVEQVEEAIAYEYGLAARILSLRPGGIALKPVYCLTRICLGELPQLYQYLNLTALTSAMKKRGCRVGVPLMRMCWTLPKKPTK